MKRNLLVKSLCRRMALLSMATALLVVSWAGGQTCEQLCDGATKAAFAVLAYKNNPNDPLRRRHRAAEDVSEEWDVVDEVRNPVTGFDAVAYKNKNTGEIVIAYGGTEDLMDWATDLENHSGVMPLSPPAQYLEALAFAAGIKLSNPGASITVTGHSLGGAMVAFVTRSLNVPGVTFNPDWQGLASQAFLALLPRWSPPAPLTNYVHERDPVRLVNMTQILMARLGEDIVLDYEVPDGLVNPHDRYSMYRHLKQACSECRSDVVLPPSTPAPPGGEETPGNTGTSSQGGARVRSGEGKDRTRMRTGDQQEHKSNAKAAAGSVMLEFVIAFPLILTLIFAVIQFAHIWVARLVVHYAAFCTARAALATVCDTPGPGDDVNNDSWPRSAQLNYTGLQMGYRAGETQMPASIPDGKARSEAEWAGNKAAAAVCSWIVMGGGGGAGTLIPGWGIVPGSDAAERKTRACVEFDPGTWNVKAIVEHDFALITPIVGPMIAWGMDPWDRNQPWAVKNADMTDDAHKNLDSIPYPHIRLAETVWLPKPYRTVIAAGNWSTDGQW